MLSQNWWQDDEYRIATLWALGAVSLEQYETEEARNYLEAALSESQQREAQLPWIQFDQIEIKLFLALVEMRLGNPKDGMRKLEEGFEVAKTLGSKILEGKLRNNYAAYFDHYTPNLRTDYIGNYEQARSQYETGLSLLNEAGEIVTRTSTLANLGRLSIVAGELSQAQTYYQRALTLNNVCHNEVLRGYLYSQLGGLYLKLGEVSRAKHYLQHSFQNRAMAKATKVAIQDQIQLGKIARLEKQPQIALDYLLPLIEDLDVNDELNLVTPAFIETARTYLDLNQPDKALDFSSVIYEVRGGLELPSVYSEVSRVHIEGLFKTNNTDAAKAASDDLLAHSRNLAYSLESIEVLSLAMSIYSQIDLTRAIEYGQEACELVETLRAQLDLARSGPSFADQTSNLYQALARLFFSRASLEKDERLLWQGVGVLERGKAAVLEAQRYRSSQTDENEKLREAKRRVNVLASKRMSSSEFAEDPELTNAYFEALEGLSSELSAFQLEATNSFDLSAFTNEIPDRHLILEFIVQDNRLGVVLLSKGSIDYEELDEPLTISDVNIYLKDVRDAQANANFPAEKVLPKKTLERILAAEVVTLIPAGPLHHLPFASLFIEREGRNILLNDVVSIVHGHSLSGLMTHDTKKEVSNMCIFADPQFQQPSESTRLDHQEEQFRDWSANLERLPWTAKEATYIQNSFPELECTLYQDHEATKQNLCAPSSRLASVLHIASHGYFSSRLDDVAGIALAPVPGQADSSFFALTDLFDLKFSSHLVVVSGCETGMGRSVEGEGLMSISRGFMSQGAETVVSTLWPVSDRASALFMKYFYQYLAESESPVLALKKSQAALRETPRYSVPFYWATYVVHSSNLYPRLSFKKRI